MSVGAQKTVGVTPAEHADQIQGRQHGKQLQGHQPAVAVAVLDAVIVDKPSRIRSLRAKLLTTGTAGQTDLDLRVVRKSAVGPAATVMLAAASIAFGDPNGTELTARNFSGTNGDDANLEPGDVVQVQVTAAPTAGANLFVTVELDERFDPPVERPLLAP